jgi:hypothetical protein
MTKSNLFGMVTASIRQSQNCSDAILCGAARIRDCRQPRHSLTAPIAERQQRREGVWIANGAERSLCAAIALGQWRL